MNTNIMVQLRQADAIDVTANGEYECILSKDLTIENGDVVQLSKAFLDSVKEGDITIAEDLTLTIQSGVYFTNWTTLTGDFIDYQGETIPCNDEDDKPLNAPCFKRFIPYLGVDTADLAGCTNYTTYTYYVWVASVVYPFTITYSYVDYMGVTQYTHTKSPEIPAGFKGNLNIDFNGDGYILAKTGTLKIVSPSFPPDNGITPVGPVGSPVTAKMYNPFVFNTVVNLPKGVYSPTQLSTYISQQLASANLTPNGVSQNMNNTKFQFAITDFDLGRDNPNGQLSPNPPYLPVLLTEQTTFISDDGIYSYKFPINNNLLIGTSQISLEYDSTADIFKFNYIHLPMLDSSVGQNISVRFLRKGLIEGAGVFGVTENSGIYFTSLTAKNKYGKNVDFWSGQLGFDLSALCVGTNDVTVDRYGLAGVINLSEPLIDGVNVTSGYYGLDAGVIRGTSTNPNTWYTRQSVPSYSGDTSLGEALDGICSTINSTNSINAVKTLDLLLDKFSHYILQTDLGFNNNNFIGDKWFRNINGIITRYFSYGSYTFSDTDGAIQYVHNGAPMQLKSVRVRILKSDMTIDDNLGNDNTIILQVIKAGSQFPPIKKSIKD